MYQSPPLVRNCSLLHNSATDRPPRPHRNDYTFLMLPKDNRCWTAVRLSAVCFVHLVGLFSVKLHTFFCRFEFIISFVIDAYLFALYYCIKEVVADRKWFQCKAYFSKHLKLVVIHWVSVIQCLWWKDVCFCIIRIALLIKRLEFC